MSITTIDCHYLDRPEFAAAYLVADGDEAAFIDNNTNHALPRLLAALADTGLAPEQVRYLIITHVHLDHAGGTSALAGACPNATVLAHPRAFRHVTEPKKLVDSAKSVYGDDEFRRLYGEIQALPAERVRVMEDGERVSLGQRKLEFLHTRGHANHHFCIADSGSGSVFTGDAFGLIYPPCNRAVVSPSRPPARRISTGRWRARPFGASRTWHRSGSTRRTSARLPTWRRRQGSCFANWTLPRT